MTISTGFFRAIIVFFLAIVFTLNAGARQKNIAGHYRLKYYPELKNKTGWDYDQKCREELLLVNADSTYIIERIYPQGGFEVLPDKGRWTIKNDVILLTSTVNNSTRKFNIRANGLIEPMCTERNDLSGQLWAKE